MIDLKVGQDAWDIKRGGGLPGASIIWEMAEAGLEGWLQLETEGLVRMGGFPQLWMDDVGPWPQGGDRGEGQLLSVVLTTFDC